MKLVINVVLSVAIIITLLLAQADIWLKKHYRRKMKGMKYLCKYNAEYTCYGQACQYCISRNECQKVCGRTCSNCEGLIHREE